VFGQEKHVRTLRDTGIALVVVALVLSLLAGCTAPGGTKSLSGQMGARGLSATAMGIRTFSLEVNPLSRIKTGR